MPRWLSNLVCLSLGLVSFGRKSGTRPLAEPGAAGRAWTAGIGQSASQGGELFARASGARLRVAIRDGERSFVRSPELVTRVYSSA